MSEIMEIFTEDDLHEINKALIDRKLKLEDSSILLFGNLTQEVLDRSARLIELSQKINTIILELDTERKEPL